MAVYSDLLLSNGGGIISSVQQAEQVENTATILIGLGGTGIDCLTEIKKSVRERLKPDDPEALVPTYNHIRFLAVDTYLQSGITGFDKNETFDISVPIYRKLRSEIDNEEKKELDWLDIDKLCVAKADIDDGWIQPSLRLMGRYMLMEKSHCFLVKIKEMIIQAKKDAGKASLYIHIFAGISGGTGSGIFLDACYLVKKAIEEVNGGYGIVLGYFFLPDVNLSKIPESASLIRSIIPRNGYAAMQELDYCMRLPENGGSFTQTYKGGIQIEWNEPPVDLCHLISATDKKFQVAQNAYNHSIKRTAEYVIDFLTKTDEGVHSDQNEVGVVEEEISIVENRFSIEDCFCYYSSMISDANGLKTHGYHLRYLTVGDSCAAIPRTQINTYLAAKVFESFSELPSKIPSDEEVWAIANKAGITKLESLLGDITRNGGNSDLVIKPDSLGMEFTRDNGDQELLYYYTNQKADKLGIIEKNALSMMDEKNSASLIGRICAELDACAKDLNRGPAYAYKVVQASFAGNMINIIDGMIESVDKRRSQRAYNVYEQVDSARKLYEESRQIWYAEKNKRKGKAKKAFDQYVFDMENYIRGEIEVKQLEQLLAVLKELKKQITKKADEYYLKFSRVMDNLVATFKENRDSLNADTDVDNTGVFAIPLLTIREIRPNLDAEVEKMDMPGLLDQFVTYMFNPGQDGKTVWIDEDENKISKAVKDFFINIVFTGFAFRSITQFLFDKYGETNAQVVTDKLYNDYMLKLKDRSKVLFPIDPMIYGEDDIVSGFISYISVPSTAEIVINAARRLNCQYPEFCIKKSTLKDRIYIMRCSCALPIGAYANGELYERMYYENYQEGRHYYIGKGGAELFNDWHNMLPLRPQSLIDDKNLPARLRTILGDARSVYEDAKKANLFDGNTILKASDDSLKKLEDIMVYVKAAESKAQGNPDSAAVIYKDAADKLKTALDMIQYTSSGYHLPTGNEATEDIKERIRKDYFVSSPALHTVVRREMERLSRYEEKYEELKKLVEVGENEIKEIKDFCKALFTGVITWNKFLVTYDRVEYGIPSPEPLNDFAQQDKFKYAVLPLYQAFLSYQLLDTEDKERIVADANQKFAGMAGFPDVVLNIKACESKITMEFVNRFMAVAATYSEINESAEKFIGTLMQELSATIAMVKAFGLY